MRYVKPRKALLAELVAFTVLVGLIVSVVTFHATNPAEGQVGNGRAHDSTREFASPLLL